MGRIFNDETDRLNDPFGKLIPANLWSGYFSTNKQFFEHELEIMALKTPDEISHKLDGLLASPPLNGSIMRSLICCLSALPNISYADSSALVNKVDDVDLRLETKLKIFFEFIIQKPEWVREFAKENEEKDRYKIGDEYYFRTIFAAASSGDIDILQGLKDSDSSRWMSEVKMSYHTMIEFAIKNGRINVFEKLIDPTWVGDKAETYYSLMFRLSLENNQHDIFEKLIAKNPDAWQKLAPDVFNEAIDSNQPTLVEKFKKFLPADSLLLNISGPDIEFSRLRSAQEWGKKDLVEKMTALFYAAIEEKIKPYREKKEELIKGEIDETTLQNLLLLFRQLLTINQPASTEYINFLLSIPEVKNGILTKGIFNAIFSVARRTNQPELSEKVKELFTNTLTDMIDNLRHQKEELEKHDPTAIFDIPNKNEASNYLNIIFNQFRIAPTLSEHFLFLFNIPSIKSELLTSDNGYQIFQKALDLEIMAPFEWLKENDPEKFLDLIRKDEYRFFSHEYGYDEAMVERLGEWLYPIVAAKVHSLRNEETAFDAAKSSSYLDLIKDLIAINTPSALEDIRFLIAIPEIKSLLLTPEQGNLLFEHAEKWQKVNPDAYDLLNDVRRIHLERDKFDAAITDKMLTFVEEKQIPSQLTFKLPESVETLQAFMTEHGDDYKAGVAALANRLKVWAENNNLHAEYVDQFIKTFDHVQDTVFSNKSVFPLFSRGILVLEEIIHTLESENCPPHAVTVIEDMLPYIAKCGPGANENLEDALLELSNDVGVQMMGTKKAVVSNIVSNLLFKIAKDNPELEIVEGNQVHYGRVVINYYHKDLGLRVLIDPFAERSADANANEIHDLLILNFPDKLYEGFTPSSITAAALRFIDLGRITTDLKYSKNFQKRIERYGEDPYFNVVDLFDQDDLADDKFTLAKNAGENVQISIMTRLISSGYFHNVLQEIKLDKETFYLYPGDFSLSYVISNNTRIPFKEFILQAENIDALKAINEQLLANIKTPQQFISYLQLVPASLISQHPEKIKEFFDLFSQEVKNIDFIFSLPQDSALVLVKNVLGEELVFNELGDEFYQKNNQTPLLLKAIEKKQFVIAIMLSTQNDTNINQENSNKETALSIAAMRGYAEIIPTLLACGADINHLNSKGESPLQLALNLPKEREKFEVVSTLLLYGAVPPELSDLSEKLSTNLYHSHLKQQEDVSELLNLLGEDDYFNYNDFKNASNQRELLNISIWHRLQKGEENKLLQAIKFNNDTIFINQSEFDLSYVMSGNKRIPLNQYVQAHLERNDTSIQTPFKLLGIFNKNLQSKHSLKLFLETIPSDQWFSHISPSRLDKILTEGYESLLFDLSFKTAKTVIDLRVPKKSTNMPNGSIHYNFLDGHLKGMTPNKMAINLYLLEVEGLDLSRTVLSNNLLLASSAIASGNFNLVSALIECGVHFQFQTPTGDTPLIHMKSENIDKILGLFPKDSLDLNKHYMGKGTLLSHAIENFNIEIIIPLINHGANPLTLLPDGKNAIEIMQDQVMNMIFPIPKLLDIFHYTCNYLNQEIKNQFISLAPDEWQEKIDKNKLLELISAKAIDSHFLAEIALNPEKISPLIDFIGKEQFQLLLQEVINSVFEKEWHLLPENYLSAIFHLAKESETVISPEILNEMRMFSFEAGRLDIALSLQKNFGMDIVNSEMAFIAVKNKQLDGLRFLSENGLDLARVKNADKRSLLDYAYQYRFDSNLYYVIKENIETRQKNQVDLLEQFKSHSPTEWQKEIDGNKIKEMIKAYQLDIDFLFAVTKKQENIKPLIELIGIDSLKQLFSFINKNTNFVDEFFKMPKEQYAPMISLLSQISDFNTLKATLVSRAKADNNEEVLALLNPPKTEAVSSLRRFSIFDAKVNAEPSKKDVADSKPEGVKPQGFDPDKP